MIVGTCEDKKACNDAEPAKGKIVYVTAEAMMDKILMRDDEYLTFCP